MSGIDMAFTLAAGFGCLAVALIGLVIIIGHREKRGNGHGGMG